MLELLITKRTDERLLQRMAVHYSQPKGFVGRNICYAVLFNGAYYGHIVGGSATKHLKGRHEFLNTNKTHLNQIINNIFFNIAKINDKYPVRNFAPLVLKTFCNLIKTDWEQKYGNVVLGFESLVEKPRTGEVYLRAGWSLVGETKGYTCKRIGGRGTDSWGGKRIWDTKNLRPKLVFCRRVNDAK